MFQSESTLYSCLNVKELLAQSRGKTWTLNDCNWTGNQNHLAHKQTLERTLSQTGQMIELCCENLSARCIWQYLIIMSRTSFRVNPHSIAFLNVKGLLAWSRRHILSLSDNNVIRTYNHLVRKRTLNHLAKLKKRLSCVVSNFLYGTFDCILLSCHVRV